MSVGCKNPISPLEESWVQLWLCQVGIGWDWGYHIYNRVLPSSGSSMFSCTALIQPNDGIG